jgi:hypothetical protein
MNFVDLCDGIGSSTLGIIVATLHSTPDFQLNSVLGMSGFTCSHKVPMMNGASQGCFINVPMLTNKICLFVFYNAAI